MADFKSAKADLIPPSIAPVRREAPRDTSRPARKGSASVVHRSKRLPGNQYLATTGLSQPQSNFKFMPTRTMSSVSRTSRVTTVPATVVTNGLMADAVEESRTSIREGHGMTHPLAQSGLFPPLLIEMIRVGERSGELESMLERVADTYEREVDRSLNQLTTLLEPLMTLAMAGIILFMMLAILLPIFQLNQLMK